MITNAKAFNERTSEIFADAERIRKALSNFMPKHNPAYRDANYVAFPTPLPGEESEQQQTPVPARPARKSTAATPEQPAVKPASPSTTPAVEDAAGAGEAFDRNTLQEAQDKIVTELLNYKDDRFDSFSTVAAIYRNDTNAPLVVS